MQVVPVRPEQYDAVGEMTVRAYAALDPDLGDYADELRDVAGHVSAGAAVLVVEEDGHPVGTVTYVPPARAPALAEWEDPKAAGIRMLAVRQDRQGHGIGTALVNACLQLARQDGAQRVVLHTTGRMRAAQRLYARLGFERAPAMDVEVLPGLVLIGYQLVLAPAGDPTLDA